MATGVITAGTTTIRNDGGTIFVGAGNTFTSSRFDEFTEGIGVGVGVDGLPKSGLSTIDQINAAATDYCDPGQVVAHMTTDLAGVSNTNILNMDKGAHLQTPKIDQSTPFLVATAIRNNQWSDVSGRFTVAPAVHTGLFGTDFSSLPTGGINSTAGTKIRFMAGGPDPSGTTYKGQTLW